MSVIRCACALLVTPYKLRIVNNWATVAEILRTIAVFCGVVIVGRLSSGDLA